ncbi:hypothetical protein [Luteococcus sanguinis]|uniref:Uncharacterized protein n=1 Tax=Luteococcus sanguinis TaxID=174038 RepID=A0ABW1X154_9ACTN
MDPPNRHLPRRLLAQPCDANATMFEHLAQHRLTTADLPRHDPQRPRRG